MPEISATVTHLRDVLGNDAYESLSRAGEHMTAAEMMAYAYGQIDRLRAELG